MGIFDQVNNNVKMAEEKDAKDVATQPDKKLRNVYADYATGDDRIDYSVTYDKAVEDEMRNRGFIYDRLSSQVQHNQRKNF